MGEKTLFFLFGTCIVRKIIFNLSPYVLQLFHSFDYFIYIHPLNFFFFFGSFVPLIRRNLFVIILYMHDVSMDFVILKDEM